MELKDYVEKCHATAREKGFWDTKRELSTMLMLIVSELGEALEADRHNKHAVEDINFESYESLEAFITDFEEKWKDTFSDEICDTFIRLFDMCGGLGIDIEKHIIAKMTYNETRARLHGKKY